MVWALFSIYSNVSDVGKLSDFISCAYVLQTLQREVLCPPQSCYIQQIKCLKGPLTKLQLYKQLAVVIKTTTKSAGNILLQCGEISTVIL